MLGDKYVCINNKSSRQNDVVSLTIGKIYIFTYFSEDILVITYDDDGEENIFSAKRFVSLKEFRKLKLEEILRLVG